LIPLTVGKVGSSLNRDHTDPPSDEAGGRHHEASVPR